MRLFLLSAFIVGACTGDAPPDGTPACTKALYDTCNTEHDCTSNSCHNFAADGFQVCTTGCSATMPCPMLGTMAVECNAMGICKPPMQNLCEVQP